MCPAKTTSVGRVTKANTAPTDNKTLHRAKLNPSAVEFISLSSASESHSPRDEVDSSSQDSTSDGGAFPPHPHDVMDRSLTDSRAYHGWESPQGVLPASPTFHHGSSSQEAGLDGSRGSGVSSPPPLPLHPAMLPAYSWGAGGYPGYYMYPPETVGSDRAASPPGVFPAGGSPPLAPGFISVPLGGSSPPPHPSVMYGGSPGSSPPGTHYMYLHPHAHHQHGGLLHSQGEYGMGPPSGNYHPGHGHAGGLMHQQSQHPQHRGASPVEVLSQRFSVMGMSGVAPGGSSPTGSSASGGRGESRASARIARSHRAGGAYNPSDFEFKLEEAESGGSGARTTVMIRNIPNKYNQQTMLGMLEEAGFNGTFDFFYLPIDFRNRCGLGYAFVNFLSPGAAANVYRHFHGRRWDEFNSKKVCEITYARVQGRDALVQHFKSAKFPSEDPEYQPLVYERQQAGHDAEDETSAADANAEDTAHSPLPIHAYLAGKAADHGEGKDGESIAGRG